MTLLKNLKVFIITKIICPKLKKNQGKTGFSIQNANQLSIRANWQIRLNYQFLIIHQSSSWKRWEKEDVE